MANRLPKGITQRGSKFRVSIMVAGVRRTATCDTLVDAIQEAEAIRAGVDASGAEKATPWTLQEAVDALMSERVIPNATSGGSVKTRQNSLKKVVQLFGDDTSVDEIGYPEVMRLTKHLRVESGLSPAYTNGVLISLKMALDHAWQSGRKTEAPVKIEYVRRKSGRIRYLTQEEERFCLDWLSHCGQDNMHDLFVILIDTGIRIGELLHLTWQDVDFKSNKLHIWKSKSAEPRAVVMTNRVRDVLSRRRKLKPHSKVMGGMQYQTTRLMWMRMREGIGMMDDKDFVIHVLRHTCCTRLVSGGIDLRTVQKWMGHENIQTTMKYAQFVPENLVNAAAVLEPEKPDVYPQVKQNSWGLHQA